jgi:Recombination endonuclease VII
MAFTRAEISARYRERHPDKAKATQVASNEKRKGTRKEYRRYRTVKKYGITQTEYDAMLEAQNGACFICGSPHGDPRHSAGIFHIDHCHRSGKVRSLLCAKCNLAVGHIENHPGGIVAIASYLSLFEDRDA